MKLRLTSDDLLNNVFPLVDYLIDRGEYALARAIIFRGLCLSVAQLREARAHRRTNKVESKFRMAMIDGRVKVMSHMLEKL